MLITTIINYKFDMYKEEGKNMDELVEQITKEIKDEDKCEKEEARNFLLKIIVAMSIITICALIGMLSI